MKNNQYINLGITGLLVFCVTFLTSCEREISDDVRLATLPATAEIFTDNFVSMGSNFYFPYQGAKPDVFSVDNEEGYDSEASIRIDVPNADDPGGNFAGAIFRVDGVGRDLSGFDALTFWAKSTQAVTINEFGFGQNFLGDKYRVVAAGLKLTPKWTKYIIPIPDPSVLTDERGMFQFAAGGIGPEGEEVGYSFWVDEIKFENLGTVAQPRPAILNGTDQEQESFIGITIPVTGLTQTFNLADGSNQTVIVTPSYFDFISSDPSIAEVDDMGVVTVVGEGEVKVTAVLANVMARGSLTVNSLGLFVTAPIPTQSPENVISVFSDSYTNVPVDYYNGFFNADGQTTLGGTGEGGADIIYNDNGMINYTNLNFVGIGTFMDVPSINASAMTHLHIDIRVQESIQGADYINVQLLNDVGGNESSGTIRLSASDLKADEWVSFDFPLNSFGLPDRSKIGLLFFVSDNTISNILVDNIYYYK